MLFIGAGVSRNIGCDGWQELAYRLVDMCFNTKDKQSNKRLLNHINATKLKEEDPLRIITMCKLILEKHKNQDLFFSTIKKGLKEEIIVSTDEEIYKTLNELDSMVVTTNWDTHFDKLREKNDICKRYTDLPSEQDQLNKKGIYHIHGSITDTDSMVITEQDYIEAYKNKNLTNFLYRIGSNKDLTVLFIGYSLKELNVLVHIVNEISPDKSPGTRSNNNFILQPQNSIFDQIAEVEIEYYNDIGIRVIPYKIDEEGYGELTKFLKIILEQVQPKTRLITKIYDEIDDSITNFSIDKAKGVIQKICKNGPLKSNFLQKLSESRETYRWLDVLQKNNYFESNTIPKSIEDQNNPGFYSLRFWIELNVLLQITKSTNELENLKIKSEYLDKINTILNHIISFLLDSEGDYSGVVQQLVRFFTYLPIKFIRKDHFRVILRGLNSKFHTPGIEHNVGSIFLPYLIKNEAEEHVLSTLKIIVMPRDEDSPVSKASGLLNNYYLKETYEKNKELLAALYPIESAKVCAQIMENILRSKTYNGNFFVATVEDHEQRVFSDDYECQLVDFVRDMLEKSKPNQIKQIVRDFIYSEFEIFRRLAFHLINHHYDELNKLLWELKENPLGKTYIHELYELLKSNCAKFNHHQINLVLEWIKSFDIPFNQSGLDAEDRERVSAHYRKEWLLSLRELNNPGVIDLYDQFNTVNNKEIEHPGLHSYFFREKEKIKKIPIAKHDFINLSNTKKAEFIIQHENKEDDVNFFSEDRFYLTVGEYVFGEPSSFYGDLDPFLKLPIKYQVELIKGFKRAWGNDQGLDWKSIFIFIKNIISNKDFWDQEILKPYDYRDWLISSISDLITEGTSKDSHAFPPELFEQAEEIIVILFNNYVERENKYKDPTHYILNTGIGRLLIASIQYSLRFSRVKLKDEEEKWKPSIKSIFEQRLENPEQKISTSVAITMYLSYFIFLDSDWVKENSNKIFNVKSMTQWQAAMTGMLSVSSTLHEFSYRLLKEQGHYSHAITVVFSDSLVNKKLVQHIILGYFAGWDDFDENNCLIKELINHGNSEQLEEIIKFVFLIRDKFSNTTKVKDLWIKLVDLLDAKKNEPNVNVRVVASGLICWISHFNDLDDEIMGLAKKSIPFLENNWATYKLLKTFQ